MPQQTVLRPSLSLAFVALACLACSTERFDRTLVNWGAIEWKGEIVLTGNYHVASGDILFIHAGTVVRFDRTDPVSIVCEGSLVCDGSPTEPVVFVNGSAAGNSVILSGTNDSQNRITWTSLGDNILELRSYCAVSHVKAGRLKTLSSAAPSITDSVFGSLKTEGSSAPRISDCLFDTAGFSSLSGTEKNIEVLGFASPSVTNSDILGNTGPGVPGTNWRAMVYSSSPVNLRKNYWGTAVVQTITNRFLFRSIPGLTVYMPAMTTPRVNPAVP